MDKPPLQNHRAEKRRIPQTTPSSQSEKRLTTERVLSTLANEIDRDAIGQMGAGSNAAIAAAASQAIAATQQVIRQAESGFNNDQLKQSSDLVNAKGSEMDKIQEMIKQSTRDFDPSNYVKKYPTGTPSDNYVCFKCGKPGHFVQSCPNNTEGSERRGEYDMRMKRPTGIPHEHMMVVSEALPGSYLTYSGQYAVPKIDVEAYMQGKKELPPFLQNDKPAEVRRQISIPKELRCPVCGDLVKEAVLIPCCGMSYCDDCVRTQLLETEDHVCPTCGTPDVSPDSLIPNQILRKAANTFQNDSSKQQMPPHAQPSVSVSLKSAQSSRPAAPTITVPASRPAVVPRGPSVLDYKPPPKPPTPPVAAVPQRSAQPVPTLPEPAPLPIQTVSGGPTPLQMSSSETYNRPPTSQEPPTPTLDEPARNNIPGVPFQDLTQDKNEDSDRKRHKSQEERDKNEDSDRKRHKSQEESDKNEDSDRKRHKSQEESDKNEDSDRKRHKSQEESDKNEDSDRKRHKSQEESSLPEPLSEIKEELLLLAGISKKKKDNEDKNEDSDRKRHKSQEESKNKNNQAILSTSSSSTNSSTNNKVPNTPTKQFPSSPSSVSSIENSNHLPNTTPPPHVWYDSSSQNSNSVSSIPAEIMRMDSKSVELYKQALEEGKEEDHTIRIMVVGHYGVGKTALTKRLLCQEVDVNERSSTDGIDVHVERCKVSLTTDEWTVDLPDKRDEILKRLVKVLGSSQKQQTDTLPNQESENGSNQKANTSGEDTSSGVDEKILNTTEQTISHHSDIISNVTGTSDQQTPDLDTVDSLIDADSNTSCSMNLSSVENEDTLMAELKEVVASSRDTEFQNDYAKISVWDFGGQFVFYSTHQMFLTHRAIYILVCNMSQHIGDLVFDDEPYFDCSGTQSFKIEDFVDIWLTSIHGHSRIKGARSTPIILVGTHTDQLNPERKEEQIDAMFDAIRNRFAGHEASLHFIDKDFGLSNAFQDPNMEDLRQTITKVAKHQSYWGELKPAKWIPLEKMLDDLRRNGVQIIQRRTLEQLNSALPVPITSDEELDLFLRFQHEVGTILYFSIPELRDQIVLSPQFLVDALKSLITAEMFCKKKPEILDKWREFRQKGILTMSLLDAVWKQGNETFHENREHLLNLMEHLNVIARPISFVEKEDSIDSTKTQKQDMYLAPCMLKDSPPYSILESPNEFISTPCFCLTLGNIAFPSAIFNRLLVSCMSQWPIARSGKKYQIYCGCGQFDVDLQHRLTLTFTCNTVQLRITRYSKTDRHPSANLCQSVLAIVKGNLRRNCDFLSLEVDLNEFVKCPADRLESSDCLHSVEKLQECQEFPCHHHNDVAVLCSSDLLKYWIEKDVVNSRSCTPNSVLPCQVLNRVPTDRQLAQISKGIGKEFQQLGPSLGLSHAAVDQIRETYRLNVVDQIFHVLLSWRKQRGNLATFGELERTMLDVGVDTLLALGDIH